MKNWDSMHKEMKQRTCLWKRKDDLNRRVTIKEGLFNIKCKQNIMQKVY